MVPGATDNDLPRAATRPMRWSRPSGLTPLGHLGTPGDIADVVALLDRPDARWFTGHIINAAGGLAELPGRLSAGPVSRTALLGGAAELPRNEPGPRIGRTTGPA